MIKFTESEFVEFAFSYHLYTVTRNIKLSLVKGCSMADL